MKKAAALVAAVMIFIMSSLCAGAYQISFSDVSQSHWFYEDVHKLVGLGAISGFNDGTFKPQNNITRAQFIKILTIALGFEIKPGNYFSDTANHWAKDYISTAIEAAIILKDEYGSLFQPDKPVSRLEMAKMIVRALPIPLSNKPAPFEDIDNPFTSSAYEEYIIMGTITNGKRYFYPHNNATRAEASAIIVRAVEYKKDPAAYKQRNDENISRQLYNLVRDALKNCQEQTSFQPSYYDRIIDVLELVLNQNADINYVESCTIYSSGIIKFNYKFPLEQVKQMVAAVDKKATEIIQEIISPDMSESQKIKAINDYIVKNSKYDYDNYIKGQIPPESFTAYGVLINNTGVCQGYSAAFNILARKAGIKSISVSGKAKGEDHAWNMVEADGEIRYIDVTWNDPIPDQGDRVRYDYFLLDEKQISSDHEWDRNKFDPKFLYYGE